MRRLLLLPIVLLAACGSSSSSYEAQAKIYDDCISSQTKSLSSTPVTTTNLAAYKPELLATTGADTLVSVHDGLKASMRASMEPQRIRSVATARCAALKPTDEPSAHKRAMSDNASAGNSPTTGGEDSSTATQVSTTNNQVAGVDEADFLKNDNKYIYVATGSSFRIIEAWPADQMHEIAKLPVKGEAKKLFVEGNRALVYSSTQPGGITYNPYRGSSPYASGNYGGSSSGECTYGHGGCVPAGDGTETEISVFDITDRTHPSLVRSVHTSSSLVAARRIGNAVHTVVADAGSNVGTNFQTYPTGLDPNSSEAQINAAYAQLDEQNCDQIDKIALGDILPRWTDSRGGAPEPSLYRSQRPDGASFTSVLSVDLLDEGALSIASIISSPGWVYASADALYMAVPHFQSNAYGWYEGQTDSELSTIHRFAIGQNAGATSYTGTGVVKGRVLDQFAMDADKGNLRVATSSGHLPSPDTENTLTVLGTNLEQVGIVDHIAKGEDIRSVRFDGERGYMVTFKKTDPLYVFDLADPRAPKTLGELKIPGFSTYMHMMDATHLLTIGYDAADQGDFAWFTGVILQIFDVTDPKNPALAHKETIGTRGTSSEALTNHLAFTYFAPKNVLALPMTVCEGGNSEGGYGTEMTFSGLMVFDATVSNGFALKGKVSHPFVGAQPTNSYGYYNASCSNWWENATSEVKRSIVMDDFVFSVSDSRIKVNDMRNFALDLPEVSIAE